MDTNSLPAALANKTVQSRLYRLNRDKGLDTKQGISLLCEAKMPAVEGPNDGWTGIFCSSPPRACGQGKHAAVRFTNGPDLAINGPGGRKSEQQPALQRT